MLCLLLAVPAHALTSDEFEARVHRHVNVVRTPNVDHGACVDRMAERWARYLKRTGRWHHRSMSVVLDRCGGVKAGEVMARGRMKPAGVVDAWLDSSAHRAVILDPAYNRMGVGAVRYGRGWIVVADLLRR